MAVIRDRIGIFGGFGQSKHEIVSEVLLPYTERSMPLQGGFLIVADDDLQGRPSGLLGRVTLAVPVGDLFSPAGEDYLIEMIRLGYGIPEEVKKSRLRYRISLRLLGQVSENEDGTFAYAPSIRKMPHVGASVGFPSEELQLFIGRGCANPADDPGPEIGHLAIGSLSLDGSENARGRKSPVHFRMDSLVGRRTAVFARAGMGKSNFVKVLLSRLYTTPNVEMPGVLVLDPEGEYAFRNASEPGLLDVPGIKEKVLVYTYRQMNEEYQPYVKGNLKINLADLPAIDVVNTLISPTKQDTVFANTLRSLTEERWTDLVKLLEKDGYRSSHNDISRITGKKKSGQDGYDVVIGAIVNNLVPAIQRLHNGRSTLINGTVKGLLEGKIVILDLSLVSGDDARFIASAIMNRIFANNQKAYTETHSSRKKGPRMIRCLSVMEEAQFYLGEASLREDSPIVRWFKEGRKFQLGSIIVTQQPGAIGAELISQCDNFFVFHLLNQEDLNALERANIHYAGDITTSIGHEPIPGNCYLWSSRGLSFVTCAHIVHFADLVGDVSIRGDALERIPGPVVRQAREVSLPVQEVQVGVTELDVYLEKAVVYMLEKDEHLYIFKVSVLNGGGASEPLVAASEKYFQDRLLETLKKGRASHKLSEENYQLLASSGGLNLSLIIPALQRRGLMPSVWKGEDGSKHSPFVLFYRDRFKKAKQAELLGALELEAMR